MIKYSTERTLFLGGILMLALIITSMLAVSPPTHAASAGGQMRPAGQSNIR